MAQQKKTSRLEDILLQAGIIDELQLRSARARQATWGGRLPRTLAELGFASEETCVQAVGKALGMPVRHLGTLTRDAAVLAKLSVKYCEAHCVFPVQLHDHTLQLAMADPTELDVVDEVQAMGNVRVQPLLVSESEILAAISRHYRNREYRPPSRGVRRFTDEAVPAAGGATPGAKDESWASRSARSSGSRPAIGTSSRAQRTEHTFDLDTSEPPAPGGVLAGELAEQPSANTLLDEIMDGRGREDLGFTRDELARLEAARLNQEKTTTILRALQALLAEKGFLPGG